MLTLADKMNFVQNDSGTSTPARPGPLSLYSPGLSPIAHSPAFVTHRIPGDDGNLKSAEQVTSLVGETQPELKDHVNVALVSDYSLDGYVEKSLHSFSFLGESLVGHKSRASDCGEVLNSDPIHHPSENVGNVTTHGQGFNRRSTFSRSISTQTEKADVQQMPRQGCPLYYVHLDEFGSPLLTEVKNCRARIGCEPSLCVHCEISTKHSAQRNLFGDGRVEHVTENQIVLGKSVLECHSCGRNNGFRISGAKEGIINLGTPLTILQQPQHVKSLDRKSNVIIERLLPLNPKRGLHSTFQVGALGSLPSHYWRHRIDGRKMASICSKFGTT